MQSLRCTDAIKREFREEHTESPLYWSRVHEAVDCNQKLSGEDALQLFEMHCELRRKLRALGFLQVAPFRLFSGERACHLFPSYPSFLQIFVRLNSWTYLIFVTSTFKEICTRGVKITFRFGTPPTGVMLGGPKLLGPPPPLLSPPPPPPLPPPPPPPPSPPAPDERLQRLRVSTSADLKKKC